MDKWDKETFMWTGMWVLITLIVAVTVLGFMESYTKRLKTMAENGYCETPILGSHNVLWQKCSKEAKNEN